MVEAALRDADWSRWPWLARAAANAACLAVPALLAGLITGAIPIPR